MNISFSENPMPINEVLMAKIANRLAKTNAVFPMTECSAIVATRSFGASEAAIGLTVVGIGTSLPELVVSVAAARRRAFGIAVGNVIGSNIFDFLMIIGMSAVIKPVLFSQDLVADIAVTTAAALGLLAAMFLGKRYTLGRWQGFFFVIMYFVYFQAIVM